MKYKSFLLVLFFSFCINCSGNVCLAQQSDFIVLKKNNRTIKSFFGGTNAEFVADGQLYSGKINRIEKDSIFIIQYDIRRMPTNLGVNMIDTISALEYAVYFKKIILVSKDKKGFDWGASGASLFGGGALITTVGLATWLFTKKDSKYYAGPKLVAGSALAAVAGYILLKSNKSAYTINKNFTLHYISAKN
jgi:pyoverdine/dityrosine biosynthesis protein Dit1